MPRASLAAAAAIVLVAFCRESPAGAASCSVSTVGVNFGIYDPLSAVPDDSAGTVLVNCNAKGLRLTTVSLATGNSGSFVARRMANGANLLQYNLYSDSARASVWGDGSGGTSIVSVPMNSGSGSRTIYGRIPSGQLVSAGIYSDTIVVTVEF